SRPSVPPIPGTPLTPGAPDLPSAPPSAPGPLPPTRVWLDPHAEWTSKLYERLLAKRIVMVSGVLDDNVASRLSAQLLTLDAEQEDPIRLELQNVRAELPATLTVMGILDVLRVPAQACVSGEISGPAPGVPARPDPARASQADWASREAFGIAAPRWSAEGRGISPDAPKIALCTRSLSIGNI